MKAQILGKALSGRSRRGEILRRCLAGSAGKRALSMRLSLMPICLLSALIVAAGASDAVATPLSPFRYEAQAQRHCPDDTVVWLDFRKRTYYSKRQNRYARGSTGSFVCREEARSNGYRRSLLGLR